MHPQKLGDRLTGYKDAAMPRPPTNLNQNVWREIRLRQNAPLSSALDDNDFLNWFRRSLTLLVAPSLALAIFLSVGLTMLEAQAAPHQSLRAAMGLKIFSNQASPLTQLAKNP